MSDEKRTVWVFPEVVDQFFKQLTTTLHDLDALQPGTTLNAIQNFYDSMHEESKLRIELLKLQLATAQESSSTQTKHHEEVDKKVTGLSNVVKNLDRRVKNLEGPKPEMLPIKADVVVAKKGWRDGNTHPQHVKHQVPRRESRTPVPQLPTLNQLQPQNANESNGDATHMDGASKREESTGKNAAPFNSSLSTQLSTKTGMSST